MAETGRARILCLDDESHVLDGLLRVLSFIYDVVTASSGEEALWRLENDGSFAAVVCDLRMPEMSGPAFLGNAAKVAPNTMRIVLTGQASVSGAMAAVNHGNIFRFLTKPCPPDVLLEALQAAVHQHELLRSLQNRAPSPAPEPTSTNEHRPPTEPAGDHAHPRNRARRSEGLGSPPGRSDTPHTASGAPPRSPRSPARHWRPSAKPYIPPQRRSPGQRRQQLWNKHFPGMLGNRQSGPTAEDRPPWDYEECELPAESTSAPQPYKGRVFGHVPKPSAPAPSAQPPPPGKRPARADAVSAADVVAAAAAVAAAGADGMRNPPPTASEAAVPPEPAVAPRPEPQKPPPAPTCRQSNARAQFQDLRAAAVLGKGPRKEPSNPRANTHEPSPESLDTPLASTPKSPPGGFIKPLTPGRTSGPVQTWQHKMIPAAELTTFMYADEDVRNRMGQILVNKDERFTAQIIALVREMETKGKYEALYAVSYCTMEAQPDDQLGQGGAASGSASSAGSARKLRDRIHSMDDFPVEARAEVRALDEELRMLVGDETRARFQSVCASLITLRDASCIVGLTKMQALAGTAETLVARILQKRVESTMATTSLLFSAASAIKEMIDCAETHGTDAYVETASLINSMERYTH